MMNKTERVIQELGSSAVRDSESFAQFQADIGAVDFSPINRSYNRSRSSSSSSHNRTALLELEEKVDRTNNQIFLRLDQLTRAVESIAVTNTKILNSLPVQQKTEEPTRQQQPQQQQKSQQIQEIDQPFVPPHWDDTMLGNNPNKVDLGWMENLDANKKLSRSFESRTVNDKADSDKPSRKQTSKKPASAFQAFKQRAAEEQQEHESGKQHVAFKMEPDETSQKSSLRQSLDGTHNFVAQPPQQILGKNPLFNTAAQVQYIGEKPSSSHIRLEQLEQLKEVIIFIRKFVRYFARYGITFKLQAQCSILGMHDDGLRGKAQFTIFSRTIDEFISLLLNVVGPNSEKIGLSNGCKPNMMNFGSFRNALSNEQCPIPSNKATSNAAFQLKIKQRDLRYEYKRQQWEQSRSKPIETQPPIYTSISTPATETYQDNNNNQCPGIQTNTTIEKFPHDITCISSADNDKGNNNIIHEDWEDQSHRAISVVTHQQVEQESATVSAIDSVSSFSDVVEEQNCNNEEPTISFDSVHAIALKESERICIKELIGFDRVSDETMSFGNPAAAEC